MKRLRFIFLYLSFGLSFLNSRGQQIGNYISNGNFEECINCSVTPYYASPKSWSGLDSGTYAFQVGSLGFPLMNLPYLGGDYQFPRSGKTMIMPTVYCDMNTCLPFNQRNYPKNRLKATLKANVTYCVEFYVNIRNSSSVGIDALGIYFGDSSLDTIIYAWHPLIYLNPQIQNSIGNFITDTLNFVAISGTFVANGSEKYAVIGNFKANAATGTVMINNSNPGAGLWTDIFIEDVTCIELSLSAYAGPDYVIVPGDSAFIGRQPDFAIDPGCRWYKLPNMTTAIDTISGLWVKPSSTSTYVVRQELDCSPLKWDTVVVTVSHNLIGLSDLQRLSDNITLFPNPTLEHLNISFSGSAPPDIASYFITDNLGQNIREEDLHGNSISVPTSDLAPGLYQIHLKTPFGTVTKKFIKAD